MGHLIRHYFEMVLAMAAGMMVYAMLFRGQLFARDLGYELLMAAFMTVPMVALMRFRGHTWRQTAEMTGAMLAPWALVLAVANYLPGASNQAVKWSSHGAMLLGMLALMLYRRADYAHASGHPSRTTAGHH